ncbi:hypothetical protein SAY87_014852 [Trapa incisa]|uniref:Uncharacterized protein n=1 Tax=Trapa incisa TaxID=236973 RepID=A0AAN7JDM8_9MYRT|nr:hypothetical protein SAY87_014852 [Trapa incisa]
MSSSMLGSQSLVLATTAMVVSSTVLFLAYSRHKPDPPKLPLRSCLSSDGKKTGQKKKKVKFAESVKDPRENGEEFRRKQRRGSSEKSCRECEISSPASPGAMPANRAALYNGILRDRAQRMACSY